MVQSMLSLKVDKASEKKLLKAMKVLPQKVFKKVVGKAANSAMTPVLKTARKKVPKRTGLLRKSLGKKKKAYPKSQTVVVIVGARKGFKDAATGENPVNISHLVERGTKPHVIPAPQGGLMIGPVIIKGTVQHPGSKAQPFIEPALDENATKVLSKYNRELGKGIERETKKLGKQR